MGRHADAQGDLALFTDLYELTMLQSYFDSGLEGEAVFSLFVRRLPEQRNFLLACGLADVLDYLENLAFGDAAIDYLRSLDRFSDDFLDRLRAFRFEGDVYAMAEGTPVFADEPILEIVAPIPQGQLIETFVMNQVHLQTLLASKAARVVQAAAGRTVVDFGARRSHGTDAALKAARASYIAGVAATSNVLAGARYGIPLAGTMAHSFVEAFDSEIQAFRAFARSFPETVLLVDTYDTLEGIDRVIALAGELGYDFAVNAVRLDSGDIVELAIEARRRLDAAGLDSVGIFTSGGLDEFAIAELMAQDTPVTGFGVGTQMDVSGDAPALDIAYKLTVYDGVGRLKLSPGKSTLPGRKQVFRREENFPEGGDVIGLADESLPGRPLLRQVMRRGRRLADAPPDLEEIRAYAAAEVARLPESIRAVQPSPQPYPVALSPALEDYARTIAAKMEAQG